MVVRDLAGAIVLTSFGPQLLRAPNQKQGPAGIVFVLQTGIPWEYLPQEMGCGSGMTCWRRLREWQEAGVWQRLHGLLLARLHEADRIDWSRAAIDSSHVRAFGGAPRPARARSIAPGAAPSTT